MAALPARYAVEESGLNTIDEIGAIPFGSPVREAKPFVAVLYTARPSWVVEGRAVHCQAVLGRGSRGAWQRIAARTVIGDEWGPECFPIGREGAGSEINIVVGPDDR